MSSYTQDRDFISTVIGTDLLENAIEWIRKNMNPSDVFNESDLKNWAEDNNYEIRTDE